MRKGFTVRGGVRPIKHLPGRMIGVAHALLEIQWSLSARGLGFVQKTVEFCVKIRLVSGQPCVNTSDASLVERRMLREVRQDQFQACRSPCDIGCLVTLDFFHGFKNTRALSEASHPGPPG